MCGAYSPTLLPNSYPYSVGVYHGCPELVLRPHKCVLVLIGNGGIYMHDFLFAAAGSGNFHRLCPLLFFRYSVHHSAQL